ncbi:MAG: 6-bladed beta-propeller [Gemmatimonadota bacterium]
MRRARLAAAVALTACGAGNYALATAKIDTLPGGIVRVRNDGPTAWSDTNGWKIVHVAAVRIAAGSPGELTLPFTPAIARSGDLLVLDRRPASIKVFAPDGSWLRTIGREGAGPGEFRNRALIAATAGKVFVLDRSTSRVIVFDSVGALVAERPVTDGVVLDGIAAAGAESIILDGRVGSRQSLVWLNDSLVEQHRATLPAALPEAMWSPCALVIPFQPSVLGIGRSDHTAIWGRTDSLKLLVTRTGSDTTRIIEAVFTAPEVTDADRTRLFSGPGSISAECPVARAADLPARKPLWRDLHHDGQENVWVELTPDVGKRQYAVFSPVGEFLGRVPDPFDPDQNTFWLGDVALEFETAGDGSVTIHRWEVRRSR